jgi:hypothetical protein
LVIFKKWPGEMPSLRALAKQSRSEFQLKIGLDCFANARKDGLLTSQVKMAKVQ